MQLHARSGARFAACCARIVHAQAVSVICVSMIRWDSVASAAAEPKVQSWLSSHNVTPASLPQPPLLLPRAHPARQTCVAWSAHEGGKAALETGTRRACRGAEVTTSWDPGVARRVTPTAGASAVSLGVHRSTVPPVKERYEAPGCRTSLARHGFFSQGQQ